MWQYDQYGTDYITGNKTRVTIRTSVTSDCTWITETALWTEPTCKFCYSRLSLRFTPLEAVAFHPPAIWMTIHSQQDLHWSFVHVWLRSMFKIKGMRERERERERERGRERKRERERERARARERLRSECGVWPWIIMTNYACLTPDKYRNQCSNTWPWNHN